MNIEEALARERELARLCSSDPGLWNIVQAEREWELYGDACDPLSPHAPEHELKLLQREIYLEIWEATIRALRPGDRVLVAGGGTGRFAVALLGRGLKIDLVDASPTAIARARMHLGGEVAASVGDLTLPDTLPQSAYELVLAVEVACYATDPTAVMRSLHKALKPSGGLLYSVEGQVGALLADRELASTHAAEAVLEDGKITLPGSKHVHYYSREGAASLASDVGMRIVDVSGACYVPDGPFDAHIDASRLGDESYRSEILGFERRCRRHPVLRELPRAWAVTATT